MGNFKLFLTSLFIVLCTIPAWIIAIMFVPVMLLFPTTIRTSTLSGVVTIKRIPRLFRWWETPDAIDINTMGRYEPAIQKLEDRYGWFFASYVWLAWRNVFHGFAWQFGKEATNYLIWMTEEDKAKYGIFRKEIPIGFLKVIIGYAVHKDTYSVHTDNGFWAVPVLSLRLRSQD